MKKRTKSNILVSRKPTTLLFWGFFFIASIGVLGEIYAWTSISHSLVVRILGIVVFFGGWFFHLYCHKFHAKAHEKADHIQDIVSDGPFAVVRHPMYLGLILMYVGMCLAWNIVWTFIPAACSTALIVLLSIQEEAYLTTTLGKKYREYRKKVRWRFIPGLF